MKKTALLLASLLVLLASPAQAAMIVNDHFDGSDLASSWNVSMASGATNWDYHVANSQITPDRIGVTSLSVGGTVLLSQSFNPIDDFNAEFKFSWDEPNRDTIQTFGIRVLDSDNNVISALYCNDAWLNALGQKTIRFGDTISHHGGLPLNGSGTASMVRENGTVSYYWNNQLLASKQLLDRAVSFELAFRHHPWYGQSEIGTMSVDYVTLEGDPVDLSATPEPGTMVLLGSALGLGALIKRRRKMRA